MPLVTKSLPRPLLLLWLTLCTVTAPALADIVAATVKVGNGPGALAVNPVTNRIYVSNTDIYYYRVHPAPGEYKGNTVTVIDGASNTTKTISVGKSPGAVAVNPATNKIYVANISAYADTDSGSITVIDGTTNTTSTVTTGRGSNALAVNVMTNKIYVTSYDVYQNYAGSVTVIDGATDATLSVPVGPKPGAIAVNPVTNRIYVMSSGVAPNYTGSVTVIDGATNSTDTVPVGSFPRGIAVNAQTNKIYVTNHDSNSVTVIDGATNTTSTVAVGDNPGPLAVNPVTNKIYVANISTYRYNNPGSVTVIDGATNSTSTVTVGKNPRAVALNPVTNKIYVTALSTDLGPFPAYTPDFANNITVIDGVSNTTSSIDVAPQLNPVEVVVNPVTNRIYIANTNYYGSTGDTVTVIDAAAAPAFVDVPTYVPAASAATGYVSYLRIINSGTTATPVSVALIDGVSGTVGTLGQLTSSLAAGAAVTFSAQQIETALERPLSANDRSRIRIFGNLSPVEVQSLLRQPGGVFNDVSNVQAGASVTVNTYVPAAAASSGYASYLRVINTASSATPLTVAKIDAATGIAGSPEILHAALPAGAAMTFSAAQIEATLGSVIAASERPRIVVSGGALSVQSFLSQPGGAFTNVSTGQSGTTIDVRSYVPAAVTGYTSFLRVINDSGTDTSIPVSLIDDATGTTLASGTLIASLPAGAATTLSSVQVETALGVTIPAASRPRLRVSSPSGSVNLQTQSFLLQPGGVYDEISNALSGTSVTVRSYVPAAEAASGTTSYLRIINTGATATAVTAAVIDGATGMAGNTNTLIASLPAGAAQTLSANQIEAALNVTIPAGTRPRIMISGSTVLEVQSFWPSRAARLPRYRAQGSNAN